MQPLKDKDGRTYSYDRDMKRVEVQRCWCCNGSGTDTSNAPPYDCNACAGTGWK